MEKSIRIQRDDGWSCTESGHDNDLIRMELERVARDERVSERQQRRRVGGFLNRANADDPESFLYADKPDPVEDRSFFRFLLLPLETCAKLIGYTFRKMCPRNKTH